MRRVLLDPRGMMIVPVKSLYVGRKNQRIHDPLLEREAWWICSCRSVAWAAP